MTPGNANGYVNVQYYVVSLLDILSQRAELAKWAVMPTSAPSKEFETALGRTVVAVVELRKRFEQYAADLIKGYASPPENIDQLSRDQREEVMQCLKFDFRTHFFSDTLIGYSKLNVVNGITPLIDVTSVLGAAGMTVLLGLSSGLAVRGAVDIGAGTDAIHNECYGPVLASVYQLEQGVAEYPRIVIGKSMLAQLEQIGGLPNVGRVGISRRMARYVLDNIIVDTQGVAFFDMLGGMMRESMPTKEMAEMVGRARTFVQRSSEQFLISDPTKLGPRYARLQAYFESRSQPWNVEGV